MPLPTPVSCGASVAPSSTVTACASRRASSASVALSSSASRCDRVAPSPQRACSASSTWCASATPSAPVSA
eukprot:1691355-Pyramimonas_sp.AAC.1